MVSCPGLRGICVTPLVVKMMLAGFLHLPVNIPLGTAHPNGAEGQGLSSASWGWEGASAFIQNSFVAKICLFSAFVGL